LSPRWRHVFLDVTLFPCFPDEAFFFVLFFFLRRPFFRLVGKSLNRFRSLSSPPVSRFRDLATSLQVSFPFPPISVHWLDDIRLSGYLFLRLPVVEGTLIALSSCSPSFFGSLVYRRNGDLFFLLNPPERLTIPAPSLARKGRAFLPLLPFPWTAMTSSAFHLSVLSSFNGV